MLEYAKTPTILTKRIIVTPRSVPVDPLGAEPARNLAIDVDFLIREARDYSWFRIPEFKKYINLYVLEVRGSTGYAQNLYSMLYDTSRRWGALKDWLITTHHIPREVAESQHSIEGIFQSLMAYSDERLGVTCHTYSLNDVIDQHSTTLTMQAQSDLDLNSGTGVSGAEPFDYLFSKEYKISKDIQNLSFICFSHVDVEQMLEDFSIDPTIYPSAIDEIHQVGGITTMDVVFEEGKVPTQSLIYVHREDETKIWNGPTHYHPPNSPSPDGYVGWMGGVSHVSPGPKPKLKQIGVRNTKVKYDADPVSIDYFGGDPGYGAPIANYPISVGNYDFSTIERSIDMISRMTRDTNDSSIRQKFEEILEKHRGDNVIDGFMEISRDLQGSAKMVFSFDYLNVIKQNSKYGYFLDFVPPGVKAAMLTSSQILSLKVVRKRVSNYPTGIGYFGENDYKPMDTDDVPHLVVETADSSDPVWNHKLITKAQRDKRQERVIAKIEECAISLPDEPTPETFRHFVLRDYDFSRVNAGVYTYQIHLIIKDGIEETLRELLSNARKAANELSDFIQIARIPKIKYKNSEDRYYDYHVDRGGAFDVYRLSDSRVGESSGHYDYEKKVFTEEFREQDDVISKLENAIDIYTLIRTIFAYISGTGESLDWNLVSHHIEVNTSPLMNGTLESCEIFYQRFRDIVAFLSSTLGEKLEPNSTISENPTAAFNARLNSYKPPAHIEVCKDYKAYINAVKRPVTRSYFGPLTMFTALADIVEKLQLDRNIYSLPLSFYDGPGTIVFPDAYLLSGPSTSSSSTTMPASESYFDDPRRGSKYNQGAKEYYKKNTILASRMLYSKPIEELAPIKFGLDRLTKRAAASSIGGMSGIYTKTFDATGFVGYIEGLSVGCSKILSTLLRRTHLRMKISINCCVGLCTFWTRQKIIENL